MNFVNSAKSIVRQYIKIWEKADGLQCVAFAKLHALVIFGIGFISPIQMNLEKLNLEPNCISPIAQRSFRACHNGNQNLSERTILKVASLGTGKGISSQVLMPSSNSPVRIFKM